MVNQNAFIIMKWHLQVMDLLYLLVKYGYYANLSDISNLMPLLLSLLDGTNDKPSRQPNEEETKEFTEVHY